MKVLSKKEWSFKFTCKGCSSELEAGEEDVAKGSFGSMGDYSTEYYATCPVCGKYYFFKWEDIPPKMKHGNG